MKKRLKSIILYAILLIGISLSTYIFYPRNYDVIPYKPLVDVEYWNLETGSTIGYIHIKANGPQQGFPILYLHGGPGGFITKDIISMLTPFADAGFDVFTYDQIGSGSSDRLNSIIAYTLERHINDLDEVIRKIGKQKVILLGQSWGSVLAANYAVEFPNRIDRVIMTGPGPIFPINKGLGDDVPPDSLNIKLPKYSNRDANKKVYTIRDKCIEWVANVFGYKLASDTDRDAFFTKLNSELSKSTIKDGSTILAYPGGSGYYAHVMTMKSLRNAVDPRVKMKSLSIPTLIMKGQYDNQKWGYTKEYLDLLPNARLKIVKDAGHNICAEQPGIYYEEILRFLK